MANRIGTFPTFANLAPPWSLPTLDSNFVSVNTAINDSSLGFVNGISVDSGSPNNYQVTCPFGTPSAYNQGMTVAFVPANANTGASTITVAPLGAVSILTQNGNPLPANAIVTTTLAFMVFVGTAFRLLSSTYNPSLRQLGSLAPGTTVISGSGANAIQVFANLNAGGNYTFTMPNLSAGTVVDFLLSTNSTGRHVSMTATDPTAVAYNIVATYPGTVVNLVASFDSTANFLIYHGVAFHDAATGLNFLRFQASQS